MNILDEIFAHKREEVEERKRGKPLGSVRSETEKSNKPVDFVHALQASRLHFGRPALIAEVKFASPSKGILVQHPDPCSLAQEYSRAGAAAISMLTDEKYFHGCLEYLQAIHRQLPTMPLLRKDFVYDPYQVYEARAAGASAVLLIAAYLEPAALADLHALACELNMAALVEVHDQAELEMAMKIDGLTLLGVNNRDLHTFEVDLQTCLTLRKRVPATVCFVAESGIHSHADVLQLSAAGVDAMLVGEALVTAPDIGGKIRALMDREA
jgi:indole-3-glycerol phosphate synthase